VTHDAVSVGSVRRNLSQSTQTTGIHSASAPVGATAAEVHARAEVMQQEIDAAQDTDRIQNFGDYVEKVEPAFLPIKQLPIIDAAKGV
jgi:hypothetical protein